MPEERLQKILSQAGVTSRRNAEKLILEGRVVVNGAVVTTLGSKADLSRDHIKVDGRLLHEPKRLVYVALYKPNNTVTTVSDPEGRATVMDLLRGIKERVYPVGRLDYHSEGLLLLTNDGEMANALMSAATHVPKTYVVKVNGLLTPDQEERFREGIPLSGRRTLPAGLKLIHNAANPWYEVRLVEGRNNQIRIMFKHFGHLVEKLRRVRIGPIELGPIKPGGFRLLDGEEVRKLQQAIRRPAAPRPALQRPTGARPASQRPATRRPANQAPATRPPAAQRPATQRPVSQRPATRPPAAQRPAAQRPVSQRPPTRPPATQRPANQRPATRRTKGAPGKRGTV